ncbi:low temperature requirement protein A [Streptacidiphilus sp. PB12-B1b]|uniref:low temperature requirement protein A n=1 Tax=Streptacidiphilus sp. PB12-B1b TaxID=2705012 RepID=UPI0015FB7CAD|nr:low temperature requirement protein A [Streptacidiphilus sp. PB12-B1b]QMU77368.1 low temperature requirement protein A [Streptacidiphilus sp. PB12-B1b]
MSGSTTAPVAAERVRPLELFFDLVFVFAVTQIASVLAARPTGRSLVQVVVLLAVTWWMYGGYAWLTNALDLERTRSRLLLLLGMAGFFVMSLSVPKVFGPGDWGLVFGAAYLVVVLVHVVGFLGTSGRRGITRIGPLNLVSALIVVGAGAAPQHLRLPVMALACLVSLASPFITGTGGFTVGAGHFVERHSLAVIIVLGESIVEVGSAAARQTRLLTAVAGPLLALALSAAMWWLYFDRDDRESEGLLDAFGPEQRGRVAVYAFGYAYFVMILGIAVTAVGMQKTIESFDVPLGGLQVGLLPLGASIFLLGLACFHRALAGAWSGSRLAAAVVVAAAGVPAAAWGSGWLALAATTAVLVGLVRAESRPRPLPDAGSADG